MNHSSHNYIASQSVGDAIVTVISYGSFVLPHSSHHPPTVSEEEWRRALSDADAEGRVPHGSSVVHIGTAGASILVDTAPRDDMPEEIAAEGGLVRSPGIIAGLAQIGVTPDQITHVLFTHAHGDHLGGAVYELDGTFIPRFPNARHLLNRHDWEGNPDRDRADSQFMIRLGPVARMDLLDLVEGEHAVVPGVTMLHTPGESPGHSVVRVQSQGETFYAVGDLLHHPSQAQHLDWIDASFPGRDAEAIRESRRRILAEAAEREALLVYTHAPFPPVSPFGRVSPKGTGYRWQTA